MHWLTLYMLNNHTLPHPDTLVPGARLSIGRPYIVAKGDSLYSVPSPARPHPSLGPSPDEPPKLPANNFALPS